MIRINQLKISVKASSQEEALYKKAASLLRIHSSQIGRLTIVKRSIDARKKPDLYYSYVIDVELAEEEDTEKKGTEEKDTEKKGTEEKDTKKKNGSGGRNGRNSRGIREEEIVKRLHQPDIILTDPVRYQFPEYGKERLPHRPVIIGTGPAGLFCGYFLAKAGYCPVLLERGADVDQRRQDVERFWQEGVLDPASNVQFGEGGAGTFSDGKLNTLVKDKYGRNKAVLETFVHFGADPSILYEAKPHIGTDVLCGIVKRMRQEIISLGGQVRFRSQVTELVLEKKSSGIYERRVKGVVINGGTDRGEFLPCEQVVLAIGHSARDTFETLYAERIPMEAKDFAVGLRIEHPQSMINLSQYGLEEPGGLGAAPYKVTARTGMGRGVYSFCMCPGGYVVNASSEPGKLAVNGMSYSGRDGRNANSAIIVSVTPEDFGSSHPLAGIDFQRRLEEKAYQIGRGKIPVQRYGDFKRCVEQDTVALDADPDEFLKPAEGEILPQMKGAYVYGDVSQILPRECNLALIEGMERFGRMISGFDRPDALLSGVESRTSSPVRIQRDENLQSPEVEGLYPCGEGAGYAGGITSAAMDGIKAAEMIAGKFKPFLADPESN